MISPIFQSKENIFFSSPLRTRKEYKAATVRKEIVKSEKMVSPFYWSYFPLLFPVFRTRNAQPRCRAASHPIFNGYGKLILSNAILRRGYLPIPMDTAQVSPFPRSHTVPYPLNPSLNRKSLSLTHSLTSHLSFSRFSLLCIWHSSTDL